MYHDSLLAQHKDLDPFHALLPSTIQSLVRKASAKSGMYTITCPGSSSSVGHGTSPACTYSINEQGLNEEGRLVARQRVEAQMSLLRDVEADLEKVEAVFYSHDVPWQFVGHEYVSLA